MRCLESMLQQGKNKKMHLLLESKSALKHFSRIFKDSSDPGSQMQ